MLTDIDQKEVRQAVKEYKSKPHTPELVTKVHQAIWRERGKLVGATYEVTSCPYTQEELKNLKQPELSEQLEKVEKFEQLEKLGQFKEQERRVGYLPKELATQESRHILGRIFPQLESLGVKEGNRVTNDENPSGWFDYETGIDAPYRWTTEKELLAIMRGKKRALLTLNQYIVAGQDSKFFTGQYLDEEGFARLGSRCGGGLVYARFIPDGHLHVFWFLRPTACSYNMGGRSSGVKKA